MGAPSFVAAGSSILRADTSPPIIASPRPVSLPFHLRPTWEATLLPTVSLIMVVCAAHLSRPDTPAWEGSALSLQPGHSTLTPGSSHLLTQEGRARRVPSPSHMGVLSPGIRQRSASPAVWLPSPLPPYGPSLGRPSESRWETRGGQLPLARDGQWPMGSLSASLANSAPRNFLQEVTLKCWKEKMEGPGPLMPSGGLKVELSCQGTEGPRAPLTSDSLKYGQCWWQCV